MKVALFTLAIASIATSALAVDRGYEPPARETECFIKEKHFVRKPRPIKKLPYRKIKVRITPKVETTWKQVCSIDSSLYMTVIVWDQVEPLIHKSIELNPYGFVPYVEPPELPTRAVQAWPIGGHRRPLEPLSPVPEPSTWSTLIAGFAVVGLCARLNRKKEIVK